MTDSNTSSSATAVPRSDLRELTADVVAAYVAKNSVPVGELTGLIGSVHDALASLKGGPDGSARGRGGDEIETMEPAVPVRRSVKDNAITCLVCGRAFKSIKRHLGTSHDLTPDAYRSAFSLEPDYPMVAPAYAAARSEMALARGFGRKGEEAGTAADGNEQGADASAANGPADEPSDGEGPNANAAASETTGKPKPAAKRRTRRKAANE